MRETLPRLIHECDAVVCVSHFTRDEAVELLGLDPARAWVAHAGVDTTRFRVLDEGLCIDFARKRLVLPLQFFLTVATLEPRKNLQGLFEAYARLKAITPDPPKLVCVGEEGFQTDEIYARLDALQLRDDVFFTGFLENEDLPYLYNLAVAMVMPSLYEGFGLPVLEAMACGTPVLASRIPALQETGGDAALYIPPEDAAGWAEAMRRLADSSALQVQLREKGLARVGQFAWSDTARKTLAVYEKLAPATS
jgi:glycosyltransferase involved in cell wall biosynthesis